MLRWLREMTSPITKCERTGHRLHKERRTGYLNGDHGHFRCVAVRVTETRTACTRCGMKGEWTRVSERGINSLTLDSDWMQTLEETGELWI